MKNLMLYGILLTGIIPSFPLHGQQNLSYTPPCTLEFNTAEQFETWAVVDGNPSETPSTWTWDESQQIAVCSSDTEAADDWLISPAITLEAGKTYEIAAFISTDFRWNTQSYTITAGKAATIEAQTEALLTESDFSEISFTEKTAEFIPKESGTYYFGIHCSSGRLNGVFSLQQLIVAEPPEYPAQITDLTVTPGAEGSMEATLNWTWPSTNNTGGTLSQLAGAKIYRMDMNSIWSSYELIATVSDNVTSGEKATYTDKTIPASGVYSYKVIAYNNTGDAPGQPMQVESGWIGEDTPLPASNVQVTVSGNQIRLTFDAPESGKNNGYIDFSKMRYRIERSTGNETINAGEIGIEELPFIDNITELGSYKYSVTAITKTGNESEKAESEAIVAGPALSVPYEAAFENKTAASLYTIVNANSDDWTWKFSASNSAFSYWGGQTADDWLISPKIRLEAGKAYRITFSARIYTAGSEENFKNIAVALGNGPTAEAMEKPIGDFWIESALFEEFSCTASVEESGEWHIGLHVNGKTNYNDVFVNALSITEETVIPSEIADLSVAEGNAGVLQATLQWTNPTTTNAGTELSTIEKLEIYRGETLLKTIETLAPGASESFTDEEIPEPGIYEYSVRLHLNGAFSESKISTKWIGEDTPLAVTNLTVTSNGNQVKLSFTPPTGTVHNGWLNPEGLGYRIERNGETIEERYTGTLPYIDEVTELNVYSYNIRPVTASGLMGESVVSEETIAGNAIEIPYLADFSTETPFKLFSIFDANHDNDCWEYDSYEQAVSLCSFSDEADDWMFTPKLKLSKERYMLTFAARTERAISEDDYRTFEFSAGQGTTPEQHTDVFGQTTIESTFAEDEQFMFSVPETGEWNIGIRCTGTINWRTAYVTKVAVDPAEASGTDNLSAAALNYNPKSMTLSIPESGLLQIVNITGMTVVHSKTEPTEIHLGNLPAGVYIATLETGNGKTPQKVKFLK